MNYLKPERLEPLAAEYVLGTLQGKARLRFERLMMQSYKARNAVWEWEQHINPMTDSLPEAAPPKRVWKQIQQRIQPTQAVQTQKASTLWIWQSFSAISAFAVVILAVMIQFQPFAPTSQAPDQLALFSDEQAKPLWLITTNSRDGKLVIKPINAHAVAVDNKAFELWMLPKQGQPKSMGLLPVSGSPIETVLSPQILSLLQSNNGLAISLEPASGSPTGLPTGPVLYQAPILNF